MKCSVDSESEMQQEAGLHWRSSGQHRAMSKSGQKSAAPSRSEDKVTPTLTLFSFLWRGTPGWTVC